MSVDLRCGTGVLGHSSLADRSMSRHLGCKHCLFKLRSIAESSTASLLQERACPKRGKCSYQHLGSQRLHDLKTDRVLNLKSAVFLERRSHRLNSERVALSSPDVNFCSRVVMAPGLDNTGGVPPDFPILPTPLDRPRRLQNAVDSFCNKRGICLRV